VEEEAGKVAARVSALEAALSAPQVMHMLSTLAALSQGLRTVLLAGGIVCVALAAVDWAVRVRRINPFNPAARFLRARIDPRLAGVERLVLRAGGHPSTTPWWAVVGYVVVALLLLALADLALSVVGDIQTALLGGLPGIVWLLVHWTFGFLILALIVRVLSTWIPPLAASRWARWSYGATDWMLRPLQRVLPALGPVDISPIVAYFGLTFVRWLVESVLLGSAR
jgi:YggT family protein